MKAVLKYHHGSIAHAIQDLFPDLALSSHMLPHFPLPGTSPIPLLSSPLLSSLPPFLPPSSFLQLIFFLLANFFRSTGNKRKVFERYAAERKFDPLLAENWYSVDREDFMAFGVWKRRGEETRRGGGGEY